MPGLGPITIFDKSALESFSPDDSVWFDCFYKTNITPLFYVETLADLQKHVRSGRTPEQLVSNIAYKTPDFGPELNVHHHTLCVNELMGHRVPMNGYPVVARGRSVATSDRMGIMFERAREMEAFERWQNGDFLELEHQFAKVWRQELSGLDLRSLLNNIGIREGQLKVNEYEAKLWVDRIVRGERNRFGTLKAALEMLAVPEFFWGQIVSRWKSLGGPPLYQFAPYSAHVFSIDMFAAFGLAAGVIPSGRSSNIVDLAYLYYLPFCMVFVSGDKLHQRAAPLFLRSNQDFVWAPDMKADLVLLDSHFSAFPESVKAKGLFAFASSPPEEMAFLTTRLWDRHLPAWRKILNDRKSRSRPVENHEKLIATLNEMDLAQLIDREVTMEEASFVRIERHIPVSKGKWRLLPPGVEDLPEG